MTHQGLRRHRNEDAFLLRPDTGVFAVADGMGGHAAGDIASRTAVDVFGATFGAARSDGGSATPAQDVLTTAIEAANLAVFDRSADEAALDGMGTTFTALALLPAECACAIGHVGDSRAYLLRRSTHTPAASGSAALAQLTTDHTWVQHQVDAGTLTQAQARAHPHANVLTRALGTHESVAVDLVRVELQPHDLLLLCSDGLTAMIDDADLEAMLARELPLEQQADQLVDAANLRGGVDNITAVLIRVAE